MNVAFCINKLALIGLGVTVKSLIKNCAKNDELNLWFLCADLDSKDKGNVKTLLDTISFYGNSQFIDFDPIEEFGTYRSLHGDWTTYGRLLLPEILLNEKTVLYLDADLVVNLDVTEIVNFDIEGSAIAAVAGTTVKYAIEHKFLMREFGLTEESRYFNAGVLLMNLDYWRTHEVKKNCLKVAENFSSELIAVDQSILNALFSKTFLELPKKFNCPWYANQKKPTVSDEMILHFVGSPKPWDLLGAILHNGHGEWAKYLINFWTRKYNRARRADFLRAWKIRNSYGRVIKGKLKAAK